MKTLGAIVIALLTTTTAYALTLDEVWDKVKVGQTQEEVKAALGEPQSYSPSRCFSAGVVTNCLYEWAYQLEGGGIATVYLNSLSRMNRTEVYRIEPVRNVQDCRSEPTSC